MKKLNLDPVTRVNALYGLVSFGATFYMTLWMPFALNSLAQDWSMLAKISALLWIGNVVGEIPTGILTDRWGARKAMLAYAGLSLLSAFIASFGSTYAPLFFLAHFLQGVALSFLTGIFSLRLKEEQRFAGVAIDYKRAVTQGAAYRAILSVVGIGLAWIALRSIGPKQAFTTSIGAWLAITILAARLWRPLPVEQSDRGIKEILRQGPDVYRRNRRFRNLSLTRVCIDFGAAALVEYAISLVAPDLGEGSHRYLIYSMTFAGIRLFSSRAVALVDAKYTLYAFAALIAGSFGLLSPEPSLALMIIGLLFVFFYLDYQVHSEAIEALDEVGASTALSFQGLTMSLTSALSLYVYGTLLPWLGGPRSMVTLIIVGTLTGSIFYLRSSRTTVAAA